MSISVNGQSQVPPGFRFHPTEEELLQYYLKKKVALEKIDLDVIQDVDLNKLEPWDIQEKCKIGTTPQNDWYFFSHKDKKYPTGTRTNRATSSGFWKATGRDKVIYGNSRRIGMRKTLVFYKGRAPHGKKSDWIMHEYRLDDNTTPLTPSKHVYNAMGDGGQEEGWVICRVFKKKNLCTHKTPEGSPVSTTTWSVTSLNPCNEAAGTLEQMLQSIDTQSRRNQFLEAENRRFLKLPSLYDSPRYQPAVHVAMLGEDDISDHPTFVSELETGIGIQDWAALDRLMASHLNGPTDTPKHLPNFMSTSHDHMRMSYCSPVNENHDQMVRLQQNKSSSSSSSTRAYPAAGNDYDQNEADLWNFPVSSNDQLCQLSNVPI